MVTWGMDRPDVTMSGNENGGSLEKIRLEKINVQEVGARTSLRFRMKQ